MGRDRDWVAVELVAGTTYRINLEGVDTAAGTLPDPRLLGIYTSDGTYVAGTSDDDGGTGVNSRLFYTPAQTGTYVLLVSGKQNRTGTYRVQVRDVSAVSEPAAWIPRRRDDRGAGPARRGGGDRPARYR